MHGFHPSEPSADAVLLSSAPVDRAVDHITGIRPVLLEDLGLPAGGARDTDQALLRADVAGARRRRGSRARAAAAARRPASSTSPWPRRARCSTPSARSGRRPRRDDGGGRRELARAAGARAAGALLRPLPTARRESAPVPLDGCRRAARTRGRRAGRRRDLSRPRRLATGWPGRWSFLFDRAISRLLDCVIAVSAAAGRFLVEGKGYPADRVVVVPNGRDLSSSLRADTAGRPQGARLDDAVPLIGVVGRLETQKGHVHLFDAWPDVLRAFPDARLLLVGDGRLRGELERAQTLGVDGSVIFLGFRGDMPRVLDGIDVLWLPSLYEGMPLTVIEASAMACPVVATAVDGTPEVIEHDVTGWLVPPEEPRALARALVTLLADPDRARAVGRAGRQRVLHQFALDRQVDARRGSIAASLQECGDDDRVVFWLAASSGLHLGRLPGAARRAAPRPPPAASRRPPAAAAHRCSSPRTTRRLHRRKLDSTLTQRYPRDRLEVIVVSDGSTDAPTRSSPTIPIRASGCCGRRRGRQVARAEPRRSAARAARCSCSPTPTRCSRRRR